MLDGGFAGGCMDCNLLYIYIYIYIYVYIYIYIYINAHDQMKM